MKRELATLHVKPCFLTKGPCKGRLGVVLIPKRLGADVMGEDGAEVPNNVYWQRRLRAGDVELVQKASKKVVEVAERIEKPKPAKKVKE